MNRRTQRYLVVAIVGVLMIATGIGVYPHILSVKNYSEAEQLFDEGEFEKAAEKYASSGEFRDSLEKKELAICALHYTAGLTLLEEEKYTSAIDEFTLADGYADAQLMIDKAHYEIGAKLEPETYSHEKRKDYVSAAKEFIKANNYQNSYERVFNIGVVLLKRLEYRFAQQVFSLLEDDTSEAYNNFAHGMHAFDRDAYDDAIMFFEKAKAANPQIKKFPLAGSTSLSADDMIVRCKMKKAESYFAKGELASAKALYSELPIDFSYGGRSVSERLEQLEDHQMFVDLCGEWKATGECFTKIYRFNKGHSSNWVGWEKTIDASMKSYFLDIRCRIADDGQVILDGEVEFERYLDWSDTSTELESKKVTLVFTMPTTTPVNSVPIECVFSMEDFMVIDGIWCMGSYHSTGEDIRLCPFENVEVVLSYDGGGFFLDYTYLEDDYHINYDYEYICEFMYGQKIRAY